MLTLAQAQTRKLIVTILAFRWPHLRPYMVGIISLRLVGLNLKSLDRVGQT
ncbi:hypothetical protein MTR67_019124 [Solanum verrucosum]|uniref:Uncharacterized protein n=1 Tax=Solanum verrucosum TaxID=315347 RepID=A0AAF0QKY1_SOLVR|nr:hypothetical protein MTR67_019124 [Solanum verrucosum]